MYRDQCLSPAPDPHCMGWEWPGSPSISMRERWWMLQAGWEGDLPLSVQGTCVAFESHLCSVSSILCLEVSQPEAKGTTSTPGENVLNIVLEGGSFGAFLNQGLSSGD